MSAFSSIGVANLFPLYIYQRDISDTAGNGGTEQKRKPTHTYRVSTNGTLTQILWNKSIHVPKYKYLGIYLDQHLSFDDCTTVLSDAAGRALGGVINKFKEMKDMGFETFEKMYETAVTTVNDYAA